MTTYIDLLNAILAMDSYNRGYLPGLVDLPSGQIGNVTIGQNSSVLGPGTDQAAGFFAQSYILENGDRIISYRGTDINFSNPRGPTGTDLLNAYGVGGGIPNGPQAQLAVQFYNQVLSASPVGTQISLTGHSSGGGLAGFVATLYGKQGWLFDNMAFEQAALNAFGKAKESYDGAVSDPQSAALLQTIYGGNAPWQNDRSRLQAWNTDGEFLGRNRVLQQTPSTAMVVGPGVDLPGLDNGLLGGNLHSSSLLILLMYADYVGLSADWMQASRYFLPALFNNSIATAIDVGRYKGQASPADVMRDAIAYSALGSGSLVFGNTGVKALFDDATDLGRSIALENVSTALVSSGDSLGKILAQFAGQLAIGKVTDDPSATAGILGLSADQKTLSVNLDAATWALGSTLGNPRSNIVGLYDLLEGLSKFDVGRDGDIQSGMKWLWGSDSTDVFDKLQFATQNSGLIVTLPERQAQSSQVSMFVAADKRDEITGSSGNDLIYGGEGKDELWGGGGNDLLAGGGGDDTLHAGTGKDYLAGGDGVDTAIFDQSGGPFVVNKDTSTSAALALIVTRGSDMAELQSIETAKLTGNGNTLAVGANVGQSSSSNWTTIDLGATLYSSNNTLDFTQYGRNVYLGTTRSADGQGEAAGLYVDQNMISPTGLSFTGMTTLNLGGGNNKVDLSMAADPYLHTINMGAGNNTISTTNINVIINLGSGTNIVKATGKGTIVHSNGGNDKIEASHNGQLLIENANTTDRITFFGNVLTGGVQSGLESKYAFGSHGEKYGRDAQGDLVIVDALGNESFIQKFNFTTNATNLTAGLFVIQVVYQLARSNGWTAGFETAASALNAMKKIAQALTGKLREGTDPLVLDLNGDGVNLSSMAGNSASFDVDKDGFAERVGWVRGGDGMLVRDLNGNGKIDDIGEMFGNDQTSGFTQLGSLDGNHDGKISAEDNGLADFNGDGVVDTTDTFDTLEVWVDANEDGKTDAGELKSLASLDIVSISTGSTATTTTDSGNTIAATGTFQRSDGSTGAVGEVRFDTDNTHTAWLGDSSVSADAASRPDLKGFGTLTDLHVAMTLDPDLVQTVDGALPSLNTLSLASLRDAARTILYAWAGAVPVPSGTPGTEATQDFWFVGDVTRTGGIAYDFVVQKGTYAFDTGHGIENRAYYGYASGQPVYLPNSTTVIDHPTIAQVMASAPQQGSWQKLSAQDIAFLERYSGVELGFSISANPSADAIQVVANGLTASWNELNRLSVRLAAQGPLAPFFAGIAYDVATDSFHPTTSHQLVPMLEAIFHATPATASAAQDYLAQWHDIINVVLPDFQRDNQGHQLTDAFLFQNLVGAYEDVPLAISLQQAAAIFDIPASEIKTGTGTLVGDDSKTDLFYLDSSNQVLQGQGGSDAYIVGNNFGHDIIQDVWQGLGQNQEDSIWFSHLNVSDLTFTRDGLDLLISQNGTSNQIRVVDEFAGRRPGLVTAFQDFDKQIEIIKFADGTTWDQLDIAKVVGMTSYATDDHLVGSPDVDFLNGGAGTDYMSGGDAGDHYFFGRGDGHDTIEDKEVWIWQATPDYVHFGAGITEDDVTFQRVGVSDDLQVSINGTNDVLTVTGQFGVAYGLFNTYQDRIEYFTFADGSYIGWEDIIKALDASAGTSGNDTITGFSYDDVLDGGAGNDFLTGGNGNDTYVFGRGYGSDTIEDRVNYILSGTDDTVKFKEGITQNDLTFHHDGNTSDLRITINGTDDSLKIIGEFSIVYGLIATMDDRIENFTFADGTVLGWHDILQQIDASAGTAGNDTIYGFGYDDILQGGAGDDYLAGGQGNDTYVYSRGDGHDTIYDLADAQGPEFDTLVLHGINPADVSFSRINNTDVALVFAESAPGAGDGGSVLLQGELDNWFAQGVEQITFDDGTIWTQSDLRVKVLAAASTTGNDIIVAFNTDDVIEGGRGDDTISGGAGDDTYIYSRGDGNDSIAEVSLGNYSSFDTLKLHDIAPSAVSLTRSGNDLALVIAESAPGAGDGGSILLKSELGGAVEGVEQVVFDDGTLWTKDDLRVRVLAEAGTDGNDTIAGTLYNDTLRGGKGDDILYGSAGDDTYIYSRGDGNDTIAGEPWAGNFSTYDTLRLQSVAPAEVGLVRNGNDVTLIIPESSPGAGDAGSVLLKDSLDDIGNQGVDQVVFDDGTVWTQATLRQMLLAQATASTASSIYGFTANDVIVAGLGDRYLNGGYGADTYIYSASGGNDVIDDTTSNTLVMQGIASTDVLVTRPNNGVDLVLTNAVTGKTITVRGQFSVYGSLSTITFSDGVSWNNQDILNLLASQTIIFGTDAAETITGTSNAETIDGLGGDDILNGGSGGDIYIFRVGSGNDVIRETGSNSGNDVVRLAGLNARDVDVTKSGNDLLIRIVSSGEVLTVKDHYLGSNTGIEYIQFADKTLVNVAGIAQLLRSEAAAYLASPAARTDTLAQQQAKLASYGVTSIVNEGATTGSVGGTSGVDAILIGTGDKTVNGSGAADFYVYGADGGNVNISDSNYGGGVASLVLNGLASTDVTLSRPNGGTDIVLTNNVTGKTVTVRGQYAHDGAMQSIVFADGVTWTQETVMQKLLDQQSAANGGSIWGYSNRNDVLVAGLGDKFMAGGGGNDTYVYSSAGGNDIVADSGNLLSTLQFSDVASTGVTVSRPDGGADIIITVLSTGKTVTVRREYANGGPLATIAFSDGVSWSYAQLQQMLLDQQSAATSGSIWGYSGRDDILVAGLGDKFLNGEGGNDTYVYSSAGGNDIIADQGNFLSTLQFTDINSTDVTLLRLNNGADLLIAINTTGKVVTVRREWANGGPLRAITFADGVSWDRSQVETILGSNAAGGAGQSYTFHLGSGQITLDTSVSTVIMPSTTTPDDVILQANGSDLVVRLRNRSDFFTVSGDLTHNAWGTSSSLHRLTFANGSSIDIGQPSAGQGTPITFTWLGNTTNFDVTGTTFGTNVYEAAVGGRFTFADSSAAGGTNIVRFNKGAQNLVVRANGISGNIELGSQISAQDVYWQTNSAGDLILKIRGDDADSINVWGDLHVVNGGLTSAIKTVKFGDGTALDMSHGPSNFTWLGNTANFTVTGTTFGTNIYEVSAANGKVNFADGSTVGGINVVKFDKGGQALNVQANNFSGELDLGPTISAQDVYWQSNGYGDLILKIRGDAVDSINVWGDLHVVNGALTSAIKTVRFSDGTALDMSHGPSNFTWFGNTANFTINGTTFGTNIYEVTIGGRINFADASAVGGTNIVKFDKGAQNLAVQASNFSGELDLGPQISAQDVYWQSNSSGDLILKIRGDAADSINVWGDLHVVNGGLSSAIKIVKFSDGAVLDMSHGPSNFTWLGNTANFTINGTTFGTNVYEVTVGGRVNFADASAVGGTNIVKFDKGAQNLAVQASNISGSIELGSQISAQDVYWQTNGSGDLILKIRGDNADSINVWGDLHATNGVVTSAIKNVKFSDGTVLDMSHGPSAFTWIGAANGYNLVGSNMRSNVFEIAQGNGAITFGNASNGGDGNNTIRYDIGDGLADVQLNGGKGVVAFGSNVSAQDVILGSNINGDLIVKFRNDTTDAITIHNDLVFGNVNSYGISTIQFSDGTAWDYTFIASNAWIRGTSGNETITLPANAATVDAGAGDDTLVVSGNGSDRIVFGGSSGHDVLDNPGNSYQRSDVLDLTGLLPSDVVLSRSGNQLIVTVPTTGATFTALWQFYGDGLSYGVGSIKFADGTVWDRTTIAANAWVRGTSGNDSITLPATGIIADAGAGDDTLTLSGTGSDRIVFGKGYGHDTLDNPGVGYNRNDTLVLKDINASDVQLSRSGYVLTLKVLSTGDTFAALGQFWGDGSQIQGLASINFADGTVWDRTTIAANAWVRGTSGNDSITLPATGITADAGAGDDTFTVSGNGSDRIIFAKGYGHDTLTNPGSGYNRDDTLVLNGINPWEVQFTRSGDAMTLSVPSTGDSFRVNFQYWGDGSQIQGLTHIQFANGSNWNRSNLVDATSAFTWSGSATNATLTGNDYGSNIFQLGAGGETAYGGARSNVFQITTSTGQAQINLSSATGSKNEIDFLSSITDENLWFEQSGVDLKIDILGTSTSTTIGNWFSGGAGALQEITAGGLKIDSQISQLVQAMATYSANNTGFDPTNSSIHALPNDTALQGAVAAAWHA